MAVLISDTCLLLQGAQVGLVDYSDDDEEDDDEEDVDSKEESPPLSKKSKLSS